MSLQELANLCKSMQTSLNSCDHCQFLDCLGNMCLGNPAWTSEKVPRLKPKSPWPEISKLLAVELVIHNVPSFESFITRISELGSLAWLSSLRVE